MDEVSLVSILVFVFGTIMSASVLFLIHVLMRSHHSGPTVSSISIPAFFIALGFFCISTPKINGLLLKYGENVLQVSSLEKKIQEKTIALRQIEAISSQAATAAEPNYSELIEEAKKSSRDVTVSGSLVAVKGTADISTIKKGKKDYWLVPQLQPNGKVSSEAVIYDEDIGVRGKINLSPKQRESIDKNIQTSK